MMMSGIFIYRTDTYRYSFYVGISCVHRVGHNEDNGDDDEDDGNEQ